MSQQPTPLSQGTTPQKAEQPPVDFSQVPIIELESARIKLQSLTRSLRKLQDELTRHNTMPRWESLQNQYNIVITQLNSLSTELFDHYQILSSRNVYPVSAFPTTQEENLLNTLLRKRPTPEAVEWIEESEKRAEQLGADDRLAETDQEDEFVAWCLDVMQTQQKKHNFFGVFTKAEAEAGESEKPHPYKIDKLQQDKPSVGLDVDQALRYMYTGTA